MGSSFGAGPKGPSRGLATLLILLLCLIWGSTWLVIKKGNNHLPPLSAAALRFWLAFLAMALLARFLAPLEGGRKPSLRLSLYHGALNLAPSYGLVYWCETLVPSGLSSVLWAVFPLMVAVMAHFALPSERLRPRQVLGLLVGFGAILALFPTDLKTLGPEAQMAGALLLLSPLLAATANVVIRKRAREVSSVLLSRNAFGVAAICLSGAALALEQTEPLLISLPALLSVGYLALVGTVLAFGCYFWLLRYLPASRLSLVAYVIPVLALLLGSVFGGESLTLSTLCFTGLVLLGTFLASRGGCLPPPSAQEPRAAR